jgi:O-antigen ligase
VGNASRHPKLRESDLNALDRTTGVGRAPNVALMATACTVSSLCIAWLVAAERSGHAAFALALAPLLVVLLSRAEHRLLLAIALIIVVPWWKTFGTSQMKVGMVAPLLALTGTAGIAAARRGARRGLDFIDLAFAAFVVAAALSWVEAGPYTHRLVTAFLLLVLPGCFYVAVRTSARPTRRLISWLLLVAGTVASLPLYYEFFVIHRPLFPPSGTYWWGQGFFRPGGAFGSPPAAVAALSMTTLIGLSLLVTTVGLRRIVVSACLALSVGGIIITFTRGGQIGFVLGLLVFVALWRPARLGRFAYAAAITGLVFVLALLPHLAGTSWYQKGVERGGTLQNREGRWSLAWPLITNSSVHLILGHGISALNQPGSVPSRPQADLATAPTIMMGGPHSQYFRTLLEEGFVGLSLLLALLLAPLRAVLRAVRRATHEEDRALLAGCAAGIVSFIVVSSVGDALREPSGVALVALLAGLVSACCRSLEEATPP